jgi:Flp pilus assembly protein TadB
MLKLIYTFFLGILIAIFVGMGVATFYPEPKYPQYPKELQTSSAYSEELTAEQKRLDRQYTKDVNDYTNKQKNYDRNVSIIVLIAAVVILAVSLLIPKMDVVSDGMLLGGVFTLIYSIGRSFSSDSPKVSFAVVTVGLIVTIILGHRKFVKPQAAEAASKKK